MKNLPDGARNVLGLNGCTRRTVSVSKDFKLGSNVSTGLTGMVEGVDPQRSKLVACVLCPGVTGIGGGYRLDKPDRATLAFCRHLLS